jgi:hypothetical protein
MEEIKERQDCSKAMPASITADAQSHPRDKGELS